MNCGDNGRMAFLLRVELPDIPGSLGALASALGGAGADIEAIEIVEHRADGFAVDDVLLELPPNVMPDALVTACHQLDRVLVHWVSRYAAGANLRMDLEAVDTFTQDPRHALERLVEVVPDTFRMDWALTLRTVEGEPAIKHRSAAAPDTLPGGQPWSELRKAEVLPEIVEWDSMIVAAVPGMDRAGEAFVMLVGRHGGPAILTSELARLAHMAGLASSVQTV